MKHSYSDEEDYLDDLRTEREYYIRRDAALRQAPDCRDPAHDGCERCCENSNFGE